MGRSAGEGAVWFYELLVIDVIDVIDAYCDDVPRSAATVEAFGPFSLFVGAGPWPYYARPTRRCADPVSADDVAAVRDRQRQLGVPEAFEWIAESSPDVAAAIEEAGLAISAHPLMVLDTTLVVPAPPDVTVRIVDADHDDLAAIQAVQRVAFEQPGTSIGTADQTLAARVRDEVDPRTVEFLAERIRAGLTVVAAAFHPVHGVSAAGVHNPIGQVTEVAGVATLPALRRRGLGAAVTSVLVAEARQRGVGLVFLSAADEAVARMYESVGFQTVGTALIAEPRP